MGKVLPAGASGEASRKTDTDMRTGTRNFQNYYFGLDNVHLLISWTYDNVHFIGCLTSCARKFLRVNLSAVSYFLEWDFLQWSGKSPLQNSAFSKKVCISIFFILTISSKKIYFVLYLRSRSFDSYFILPYL